MRLRFRPWCLVISFLTSNRAADVVVRTHADAMRRHHGTVVVNRNLNSIALFCLLKIVGLGVLYING